MYKFARSVAIRDSQDLDRRKTIFGIFEHSDSESGVRKSIISKSNMSESRLQINFIERLLPESKSSNFHEMRSS